MTTNFLLRLDAQRLRNTALHYWKDKTELRRVALVVLGIFFYLWFNIFRHVSQRPEKFLKIWPYVEYALPALLGVLAASVGSYTRLNRWLIRWSSGSWSVLPVDPRVISQSILISMLLLDSGWFLFGIALIVGIAVSAGLVWWQVTPVLLVASAVLICVAATAKIFATLILRLGNERMLLWPNWVKKTIGGTIAAALIQPLTLLWFAAEYQRQNGSALITAAILLFLAAVAAGLALLARLLLIRNWSAISASFEAQQTQQRVRETVPLANFLAGLTRSPLARLATLYNLRSGIVLQRWGKSVDVGGRRLFMLVPLFALVCLFVFVFCMAAAESHQPMMAVLGATLWNVMFVSMALQPQPPLYHMLRILPVSFGEWLRAIATLPFLLSGALTAVSCGIVALTSNDITTGQYGLIVLSWLICISLRVTALSAYPSGGQTVDFIYMAAVALCGAAYYYVSWIAVVPLALGANIYFIRKAALEWRCREEGLHV